MASKGDVSAADESLPVGWAKMFSKSKKRHYYFHVMSKKSQWEHPVNAKIDATQETAEEKSPLKNVTKGCHASQQLTAKKTVKSKTSPLKSPDVKPKISYGPKSLSNPAPSASKSNPQETSDKPKGKSESFSKAVQYLQDSINNRIRKKNRDKRRSSPLDSGRGNKEGKSDDLKRSAIKDTNVNVKKSKVDERYSKCSSSFVKESKGSESESESNNEGPVPKKYRKIIKGKRHSYPSSKLDVKKDIGEASPDSRFDKTDIKGADRMDGKSDLVRGNRYTIPKRMDTLGSTGSDGIESGLKRKESVSRKGSLNDSGVFVSPLCQSSLKLPTPQTVSTGALSASTVAPKIAVSSTILQSTASPKRMLPRIIMQSTASRKRRTIPKSTLSPDVISNTTSERAGTSSNAVSARRGEQHPMGRIFSEHKITSSHIPAASSFDSDSSSKTYQVAQALDSSSRTSHDEEDMDFEEYNTQIHALRSSLSSDMVHKPTGELTQRVATNTQLTPSTPPHQGTNVYIVIDTNVLVESTAYLLELQDHNIPGLGRPVLVIPWVVMQELDAIKDNRGNKLKSLSLCSRAQTAVHFLHAQLEKHHPRLQAQTPQQQQIKLSGLEIECNDDRLLHCSLLWKQKFPSAYVLLLSLDINLRNKALILDILTFGKKGLKDWFVSNSKLPSAPAASSSVLISSPQTMIDSAHSGTSQHSVGVVSTTTKGPASINPSNLAHSTNSSYTADLKPTPSKEDILCDDIICEVKELLRENLSIVMEAEMKEAYGDALWLAIVLKKPPWTLLDLLQCFNKHWIAVFGMFLPREAQQYQQALLNTFSKQNIYGLQSFHELLVIIGEAHSFCSYFLHRNRYTSAIDSTVSQLVLLQRVLQGILNKTLTVSTLSDMKSQLLAADQACTTLSNSASVSGAFLGDEDQKMSMKDDRVIGSSSAASNTGFGDAQKQRNSEIQAGELESRVMVAFQRVWEAILTFRDEIARRLSSHQLDAKSFLLKFCVILAVLHHHYSSLLSLSPSETGHHKGKMATLVQYLDYCTQQFDITIWHPISAEHLEMFYQMPGRREILQNGLSQLEDIAKSLMEFQQQFLSADELHSLQAECANAVNNLNNG